MQLSAVLKTAEVTGVGTLWMRVDGRSGRRLGFDNMEQRPKDGPLTKTCDWTERQIVLDIPDAAQNIHYGFFLRGTGHVWCRKVRLDKVDNNVPETAMSAFHLEHPTNLDFLDLVR